NNLPSKSSAMSTTEWLNTQTLSTTPSNPAAVVIGTGSNTLPAQTQLEVIIEMRAPNYSMSNADTWVGTSAKNTASRLDDSTLMFLESSSVSNTMVPTSRDLIFNKEDNRGNKLAGAVFALKDANNVTIETAISNTNGQVVFRDVPYGQTYRVEEVTAPVGYIRSN